VRNPEAAVERQLQIVTEAAKRLDDAAASLCPGSDAEGLLPDGRYPRRGYHKVDDEIVWNTVKDELPPMRQAIVKALGQFGGS